MWSISKICWGVKRMIVCTAIICFFTSFVNAQDDTFRRRGERKWGDRERVFTQQGLSPVQACEESSCYPATGNLLIGREKYLHASSTCGTKREERYCIVSHLKERKKCFRCHSVPENKDIPKLYHGIENIVTRIGKKSRARKWWQSENGIEDVYIQLDLNNKEFHFTHLIITFKTFRPAAMLIERSHDFGLTWKVYQYFAYDCAESFPGIPRGPRQKITDVVCDSSYSGVEPSTEGEVIFRVLPPNIPIDDPYSSDVQNLLKVTNLRINFTKLHTLGDNLLDNREGIKEKYYYAIYDMIVRGSCSCYGHASQCVAAPGADPGTHDMVHGQCLCTHNTKGANCEECEDLYNDLKWRPAIGRQTNSCKRCNCNNHASKCHFDNAVFEATGKVSGGVCDDCEHNTMGRNCEQCKIFFYQDPGRDIRDPNICQACDCDPSGSLDEGICDSRTDSLSGLIAGRCHCKKNVDGRRCDRCKNGFWNFQADNPDGCEACTCSKLGTIGDYGCNVYNGECICKRNVIGRDCNQCLPDYYGLSNDEEGCKSCDCDPGGSYDNACDVISGQCRCRSHVGGRRCDQPESGFFAGNLDYMVYEAELAKGTPDCQVLVREPYGDRVSTWTGLGFMRVFEGSHLEFNIDDIPQSLEYDIVIRYEPQLPGKWEEARVVIERPGPVDPNGPCANTIPQDDIKLVSLPSGERYSVVYPPACLEKGKSYTVRVEFKHYLNPEVETPSASVLVDSIAFIPRIDSIPFFHGSAANEYRRQEFERFRCGQAFYSVVRPVPNEVCKKYLYSIGFYVNDKAHECSCDPTGSLSLNCDNLGGQCTCKTNVVGRRCDRCAPGTYGFGPTGCQPCDCNSVGSLDNFCDSQSGNCKCRPNTYGQHCDQCQPGFYQWPNCKRCECNGHAETCDSRTGYCISCSDYTAGPKCDRCDTGYYGDPRVGIGIPCRPCPCPGVAGSGLSHAQSCELDPRTQNVLCLCDVGYAGERCDRCAHNYFGEPTMPNGTCEKCHCNRNIDETVPGNCNPETGECLKCLYNTAGAQCEQCMDGFYGDATKQECLKCVCNTLGTVGDVNGVCDKRTGQCPCLPNVVGISCDRCAPNHWNISSRLGCQPCDCDPVGSYASECNEFDGQCPCKHSFGGRKCDECQLHYWGDPHVQCYPCECNREGSQTLQCRRHDGSCICSEGIAGRNCDTCARGYTGNAPFCDPCGECFDNWDSILQELKDQTKALLDEASRIKQTGITGAYSNEFSEMEEKLEQVREILADANVTGADIENLKNMVDSLRQNLTVTQEHLNMVEGEINNTTKRIIDANIDLTNLGQRAENLTKDAQSLKDNATALQEANVEGAFNITKEAKIRSDNAEHKVKDSRAIVDESEGHRRRTEKLLKDATNRYNQTYQENEAALMKIAGKINAIEAAVPDLNNIICGGQGTVSTCDSLCGGAGCDRCGGLGCTGAVTRAENAFNFAKEAEKGIMEKEQKAKHLLGEISNAKKDANEALEEARLANAAAQASKNRSENATAVVDDLLDRIEEFIKTESAKPADVRKLADECLKLSISLEPEQISSLARQINDTISSLTDIDAILTATAGDLGEAQALKNRADRAKENAEAILDTAKQVLEALDEAQKAQDRAEAAIDKANKDIKAADSDLVEIAQETAAAQLIANDSVDAIKDMQERLGKVKNKFTENVINGRNSAREAEVAQQLAEQAEKEVGDLDEKYRVASKALDDKAKVSGERKERADRLRERAKKLAQDANSRLNELEGVEDEFDENEKRLKDFSSLLDKLNAEMEEHLNVIEARSAYYSGCQG